MRSSGLKPANPLVNPQIIRILGIVLAAGMLCALGGVFRFAYADYLAASDSPKRVQAALKIAPDNAEYWLHYADLNEAAGVSGIDGIQRAKRVDPYNAALWINAALKSEMIGDFAGAEQDLLRAAQRSRQFAPRWALANFYFRRGDTRHFWPWVKSAMQWAYQDRTPLFDLCWRMESDPHTILERGIPDDPKVLRDYLAYLVNSGRWEPAAPVAGKIESRASSQDRDLLSWYTDVMLSHHRWPDAVSAWNALALHQFIPYSPLDPGKGIVLTNGAFRVDPSNAGFDWHIADVRGIATEHSRSSQALRFDFDGQEPENASFLNQPVPVQAARCYTLRFSFRTEGIAPGAGLQWRLTNGDNGVAIPVDHISFSSDDWTTRSVTFTVPSGVQVVYLALAYRREPGTVRIEGSLWLKDVALEAQS